MLNPFPQLLVFGFFAPTLLRVAAACVFFYLAYSHYTNRDKIAHENFVVIGKSPAVAWIGAILDIAIGLSLFFGYFTQWGALVGIAVSLKYAIWAGKYPSYFVISRTAALLVLVICISLLASGAGALAFDLPL